MNPILLLTQNNLKRMLKKPIELIVRTLIVTFVFFVMLIVYNIQEDPQIHIGVADGDMSASSRYLIDSLNQLDGAEVYVMKSVDLDYYVGTGELPMGIYIPHGFEERLQSSQGSDLAIQTIFDTESMEWGGQVLQDISNHMQLLMEASDSDLEAYHEALASEAIMPIDLVTVEDDYLNDSTLVKGFGIYLFMIMLSTMTLSFKIVDEKTNGTYDRIGFSPVSSMYLTLSNIIANLLVASIQLNIMLALIQILPWYQIPGNILVLFLILLFFMIFAVALGVFMASISKTSTRANELMSVTVAPTCMIGGCLWPVDQMPDFMQRLSYLTPQRWTMDAINQFMLGDQGASILPNLVVVLCFTILFSVLASRQFIRARS